MRQGLLLSAILISTFTTWANTEEFIRDYTYVSGEADSKISARQMAMQEVKRELLNEIGTHVYSVISMSENSKGEMNTKQEIKAITAGFVRLEILKENWNGYEFYIKVRMAVDPNEILKRIKDLASNTEEKIQLKSQLSQSAKELEDLRLDMLALRNSIEQSTLRKESKVLALAYAERSRDLTGVEFNQKGMDYYLARRGMELSYDQAIYWFEKAASYGNTDGLINLADFYYDGRGVKADYEKAVDLYRKAADQGDAVGQAKLGNMYYYGYGVEKDMAMSAYWYSKSAEQGLAMAEASLATLYFDGHGVKKDMSKAIGLYRKSAVKGYANAQFSLAFSYLKGVGVEKNETKGLHWLQLAAKQGQADGQFILAGFYLEGKGVEKSYQQAIYWYQKAAAQGSKMAASKLRLIQ